MSKENRERKTDRQCLVEMVEAISWVEDRISRDPKLSNPDLLDAVNMRIVQLGEEADNLSYGIRGTEPGIPWRKVTDMRNLLAHHYAAMSPDVILYTVENRIPELKDAIHRMLKRLLRQQEGR